MDLYVLEDFGRDIRLKLKRRAGKNDSGLYFGKLLIGAADPRRDELAAGLP